MTEATNGRALATIAPAQTQQMSLTESQQISKIMFEAGLFADTKTAAQALVKVLYGQELGLGPIAAMTGIVITTQGKISLSANLMAAKVKASGRYNFRATRLDAEACSIDFYERGKDGWEKIGQSTFTLADARAADIKNPLYQKYPKNMLFARALSNGAKWYCPDAFGGITPYTPEDFDAAIDPDTGNVIEGVVATAPAAQSAQAHPQPSQPAAQPRATTPTRAGQRPPIEAAPEPHPTLPCPNGADCAGDGRISAVQIGNKIYSAEQIYAGCVKQFGAPMCYRCGEREKARREAQPAPAPVAEAEYAMPPVDPQAAF
jgi:hypothetical protein